jgi:hypothetical protein
MVIRRRPAVALAVLSASFLGCSQQYSYGPVEGRITHSGMPVRNLQVIFYPEGAQGGPRSTGFTDEVGRYRLQTDAGSDGAVIGPHRVCLVPVPPESPDSTIASPQGPKPGGKAPPPARRSPEERAANAPTVPGQFMRPHETPLRADVGAAAQTLDFQVP